MTKSAREALEKTKFIYQGPRSMALGRADEINAVTTALRDTGNLRTPGTVEVCNKCGVLKNGGTPRGQERPRPLGWNHCSDGTCPIRLAKESEQ